MSNKILPKRKIKAMVHQRKQLKWYMLVLCICMYCGLKAQQTAQVKGSVISESGELLNGVNITVTQTGSKEKQTTTTNSKGIFIITNLKGGDKYNFSFDFVGYQKNTVVDYLVNNGENNSLLVRLKQVVSNLNDVVVIGYGLQSKAKITGSVSSIKSDDLKDQPLSSFDQAIAGKLAGVRVLQTSGSPGAGLSIRIRGLGSISAGNDPLYVVDGIPLSSDIKNATGSITVGAGYADNPVNVLSTISVDDIEAIDILKDASAAAIYGSRGSNGVVLITTKKGKQGKAYLTYNGYYGGQSVSKKIKMLDAYQIAQMSIDARNNAYLDANPAGSVTDPNSVRSIAGQIPTNLLPYVQGVSGLTNTDWQDQIFRQAPIQNHTLSVSGGANNVNYFISGNYFDQDGVVIGSAYKRYSFRANIDASYKRFHYGINLNPSYTNHNLINSEGPYFDEGIIGLAQVASPIYSVYNANGSYNTDNNNQGYGLSGILNPVAMALEVKDHLQQTRIIGTTFGEYEIAKGLKYKITLNADLNAFRRDYYRPSFLEVRDAKGASVPTGISRTQNYSNWIIENTLNYKKAFSGGHDINVLLGYTSQKERQDYNYLTASSYPSDLVQTLNAGQITAGGSSLQQWSLLSYLGRIQYAYQNKYLFSAALRADGSSRFGDNTKWGYFPSISGAWRISDENFMKKIKSISDLKIKASYGLTGNFQIPNYGSFGLLGSNNYVLGNGTIVSGLSPSTLGNDKLSWEKTAMVNVGIEAGFFKSRLMIIAEYYNSNTSDLLLNINVPQITGFRSALKNIGRVNNKGFEITLATKNLNGKIQWNSSVNFAANKNTVKALDEFNTPIIAVGGAASAQFITKVGAPIGSYYTMKVDGVFKDQNELNAYPHLATSKPGDFRFVDVNGDGKIDLVNDLTITGNYLPKYTFGINNSFSYKGIDFSFSIQGVEGNQILNLNRRYLFNIDGNMNQMVGAVNRWNSPAETGDGLTNRANRSPTGSNAQISTWHIDDGSYIRVRNIALGYNIPATLLIKTGIKSLRFYTSVQNPFTITKYTGYNPEVNGRPENATSSGEDYGTYPLSKTFIIGASISL